MALGGCAWQAELPRPSVQLPEYEQVDAIPFLQQPEPVWWQGYGSAELMRLFDILQGHNLDLATARSRVEQARALLGQQQASNWPSLEAQLRIGSSRDMESDEDRHSSGLDFHAGYEIDLWGSRSAAELGAKLFVVARQQGYQSQLLQLQAVLAQSYFEFLALRERKEIARQNLQTSQNLLQLIQFRFDAGSASGIELNQQRNIWLTTRRQLLDLERTLINRERALAVLLDRGTLRIPPLHGVFSELLLPPVNLRQPADLLESRPDIRLAESQWRQSESALYQEKSKRWPRLTLSAGLGLEDILNGGESQLVSVLGSLMTPLFDGGRIRNQIAGAKVGLSIAELNYRKTVLLAMQDTVETLSELAYQRRLLIVRQLELESNQQLYALAKMRYESGDTDFINLLGAQWSWYSARDGLIQAKNSQLLATVNVFRAMGIAPQLLD